MSAGAGPLLRIEGVSKAFGRRVVLTSASVWGRRGRVTVLFGRNGSGKTTLLRVGVGLLGSAWGATHFDGEVWRRPRLAELARRGLFYLPERGLLSRRLTLGAQLDLYAAARGAERPVADFRLEELLERRAEGLSGGEVRRAELALVRMAAPRCLVADEPLLGLAPRDVTWTMEQLRGLARGGAALVLTGHEAEALLELADEVVWIVGGTTHHLGAAAEARLHHGFRRAYLGPRRGLPDRRGPAA